MDFDVEVKLAIYNHFASKAERPAAADIATRLETSPAEVLESYRRLQAQRVLFLDTDGESIRMAPPFSGIPTQHVVEAGGLSYYANCAWDAFGIPAALHKPATVKSQCGQSRQLLTLAVDENGAEASDWLFHCLVPAAKWWDDIVFT
jgi:hypothetical protein